MNEQEIHPTLTKQIITIISTGQEKPQFSLPLN